MTDEEKRQYLKARGWKISVKEIRNRIGDIYKINMLDHCYEDAKKMRAFACALRNKQIRMLKKAGWVFCPSGYADFCWTRDVENYFTRIDAVAIIGREKNELAV
jgi:hypothetical protein